MSDLAVSFSQPERIAGATLHIGDCLDVLPRLAAEGFRAHAVICDPPYHLTTGKKGGTGPASVNLNSPAGRSRVTTGFMGKGWDGGDVAFRPATWRAVRDCMLPGAHLVAFGGTRTFHRMVCAIEDAGFEIRDTLMWITGQGFPKSHNLGGEWTGWGTALKPSYEPIILARKPLSEGNVAANVLRHGTGAINVDACRVGIADTERGVIDARSGAGQSTEGWGNIGNRPLGERYTSHTSGRWPANLLHDGSPEVEQAFAAFGERSSGDPGIRRKAHETGSMSGRLAMTGERETGYADTGSASRFFYTCKADARDRAGSKHPTVKPASLMRWLVRLITPPRVIELVCETCDNIPHGQSSMRSVQPAVSDPPEGVEVLLSPVSGGQHHYSENAMSGVRKDRGSSEGSSLLKGVSRPSAACSDAASEAVRALQDSVQAEEGWRETVLRSGMRSSGKRPSEAEAEHTDGQRLHGALPSRPSNGEQTGLRHGAPDDRGGEDRAAPASVRGGASRQRNKARQQAGKPSPDDEGRSRQDAKAAQAGGGVLPPLHGKDQVDQQCPKCGGPLTRVERPGLVLDPFAGTGSTGLAADQCGMRSVLVERDPTYAGDALRKIREDAPLFADASPVPDLDAAYQCHGDLFADAAE